MKTVLQNLTDETEAIFLKIMKRQEAYRALNQAVPNPKDDEILGSLWGQLIDVFDAKLRIKREEEAAQ